MESKLSAYKKQVEHFDVVKSYVPMMIGEKNYPVYVGRLTSFIQQSSIKSLSSSKGFVCLFRDSAMAEYLSHSLYKISLLFLNIKQIPQR